MPFINMGSGFGDVSEQQVVPEAAYDLLVVDAIYTPWDPVSKKHNVKLLIEVQSPPDGMKAHEIAKVQHWIGIPHAEDDEEKTTNKQRMAKRTCALFGVDCGDEGFNHEDFNGKTARATLTQDIIEEGPMKGQKVNRLLVPRMSDESAGQATASGRKRG